MMKFNQEDGCYHVAVDVKVHDKNYLPKYASEEAACADLIAHIPSQIVDGHEMGKTIRLGHRACMMIECGISVAIPKGFKICVAARSGLAKKGLSIMNGVGQIDSDYRGIIQLIAANVIGKEIIVINDGDRIGQCWIEPVVRIDWNVVEDLPQTERGIGGFGSTGVN